MRGFGSIHPRVSQVRGTRDWGHQLLSVHLVPSTRRCCWGLAGRLGKQEEVVLCSGRACSSWWTCMAMGWVLLVLSVHPPGATTRAGLEQSSWSRLPWAALPAFPGDLSTEHGEHHCLPAEASGLLSAPDFSHPPLIFLDQMCQISAGERELRWRCLFWPEAAAGQHHKQPELSKLWLCGGAVPERCGRGGW